MLRSIPTFNLEARSSGASREGGWWIENFRGRKRTFRQPNRPTWKRHAVADKVVSVHVSGLDDLERKLYELPSKFAQKAMRQAIKPAIQIWKDEIERGARQGEYETGFLASQVDTKITTRSRDEEGVGMVGFTKEQNPARHAKHVPSAADEARWKELGTSRQPARPFIRPAFEANAPAVLALFTAKLKEILTEVFGA